MKLLRMKPGHGEILLAEGDPEVAAEERELIEAFRAQLDHGLWAAVPTATTAGRREATLVRSFSEVPRDAERVIFFPPAAGGREPSYRPAARPHRHCHRRRGAAVGGGDAEDQRGAGPPPRPPRAGAGPCRRLRPGPRAPRRAARP